MQTGDSYTAQHGITIYDSNPLYRVTVLGNACNVTVGGSGSDWRICMPPSQDNGVCPSIVMPRIVYVRWCYCDVIMISLSCHLEYCPLGGHDTHDFLIFKDHDLLKPNAQ